MHIKDVVWVLWYEGKMGYEVWNAKQSTSAKFVESIILTISLALNEFALDGNGKRVWKVREQDGMEMSIAKGKEQDTDG